jgi:GrpB-like predicted nucleotidyltransferase (UPF0157 family)
MIEIVPYDSSWPARFAAKRPSTHHIHLCVVGSEHEHRHLLQHARRHWY